MAEIHVQARKHSRANPANMWLWLIIGIIIIAAVAYFVYANKYKSDDASNQKDLQNQRNTPMPGAVLPHGNTYVLDAVA
jgi:hypothetical protein